MAVNRRQFLLGGLATAATTMGLSACAPGSGGGSGSQGGGGGGQGETSLALAWWGNPTRNKNTQAQIDAYMKANPNVKIQPQPGEFASYWERLATQTAGGTAPDIIQMDMAFISEYGNRGAPPRSSSAPRLPYSEMKAMSIWMMSGAVPPAVWVASLSQ